jgi:hypothetical protein
VLQDISSSFSFNPILSNYPLDLVKFYNFKILNLVNHQFVIPGTQYLIITSLRKLISLANIISIILCFAGIAYVSFRILKNYKDYLRKKYYFINFFFLLIIVNYLTSFIIYDDVQFFRKILICIGCFLIFLYFSQNPFSNEFTKKIVIAIQNTLIFYFLLLALLMLLEKTASTLSGFFAEKTNAVSLIFVIYYLYLFIFNSNNYKKIFFLFITLLIFYLIESRTGIIALFIFLIINHLKNQRFLNFLSISFFICIIFYTLIFTYLLSTFLEFLNFYNFIIYSYSFLNEIFTNCISPSAKECNNNFFSLLNNLTSKHNIFNFLNSLLYRFSYNFEVLNLMKINSYFPYFQSFNQLSKNFVTDIGIIKNSLNNFVNVHNSFQIIYLKTSFLGLGAIFYFLYFLSMNLIKKNHINWFSLLIAILLFHLVDDFLLGNHWTGSIITWTIIGIAFNKAKHV